MGLLDVDEKGVLAAVAEFDRVGRRAFLKQHGFGAAREYFLDYAGELYDSKAIIGVAHGFSTGGPLRPQDFTGGDESVARRLEALGYTVARLRRPDWTRDEITLACEIVVNNGWRQLEAGDERVISLSTLLQSPANHGGRRHPDFRNPAGVARKTYNIVNPGSNGNRLDQVVSVEFRSNPDRMFAEAAMIRALLADAIRRGSATLPDPDLDDDGSDEGGVVLREHLRRERDPKLKGKKLADVRRRGEPIACEVCNFDFERVYGARGAGYIECHHRVALSLTGQTKTRLSDLVLLCSNCHRMIHRRRPWLTIDELADLTSPLVNIPRSAHPH
jgi:5-methylcytosine-specific restriction enzyme A